MAEIKYRWMTEDCVSLDKIPYIGEFSKFLPSMFVATGKSKIVLGDESSNGTIMSKIKKSGTRFRSATAVSEQSELILDGGREEVEENNLTSGALVVSYGGEVDIHENVVLRNNVNTLFYKKNNTI